MTTNVIHWKVPSELKTFDRPLVCVTENGHVVTFKHCYGKESDWLWRVEKYAIKYWAFQSEIIPNE